MAKLFFTLVLASIVNTVNAQGQEGSFYLNACGAAIRQADGRKVTQEEGIGAIYCVAYLSGFLDSLSLSRAQTRATNGNICLPEKGLSNEQTARLYIKFLREHPEALHESGRSLLYAALARAFPCPITSSNTSQ